MRIKGLVSLLLLLVMHSLRAAATEEPWFNPPGGTWTPDATVVSQMKSALDIRLRPFLINSGKATRPSSRYWFQYLGRGSGASSTIEIRGRPFPVPAAAATTAYFGPWIPEDCIVHVRYIPKEHKIEDLVLTGVTCPARI
jgi:hypothetical protein